MDYCSWFEGLNANALNGTQNTEFKKTEFLKFKMFEQFYENMIYKNKNHIIWWQALGKSKQKKSRSSSGSSSKNINQQNLNVVQLDYKRSSPYPKVPITRVETWVLTSEEIFASPKSATWAKGKKRKGNISSP